MSVDPLAIAARARALHPLPLTSLFLLAATLLLTGSLLVLMLKLRFARRALSAVQVELDMTRSLLQGFFDCAPAAMYVRDKDDRFAIINKWGAGAVGQTPESMVGQPFMPFRQLSDADEALAAHERVMATGQPETGEWIYHLPDGDRIGLVTLFPIRDSDGHYSQIGGMIFDITEQKAMQAELGQTRAILESFVEHATFPVALIDPHAEGGNRFALMNPTSRDYYGPAATEAILSGDLSGLPAFWPEWDEKIARLDARVMETGCPHVVETQFRRHDGELRQLRLSSFPIFDQAGGIKFVGSAAVDLTDIHIAQENLARSLETMHQSEKLAAMGQLIAGVAHELNNPLAVVLGRAELLHEQLGETAHRASLDKLKTAADRCARIVKSFLALARQSGPRRVPSSIAGLVEIALDLTEHGLRSAGIALECRIAEDLPEIMVDDDQIVQVLINLIVNAQHALETVVGPRRLMIKARCDHNREVVVVEMCDNGPGIAKEIQPRIFDPFFSTKGFDQGTGLGLSVCKGIVDSHGGSLDYLDCPEGGALFRMTLPVLEDTTASPQQSETSGTEPSAKGHILIIDDEPEVADLLVDCLLSLECDCSIVASARAALNLFEEGREFSVIFSDVRMPDMDGMQLFNRVHARWPQQAARFVFISGDVLHRDFGDIAKVSGRPIIEKPFNFHLVREAAQAVIAGGDEPS